MGKATIEACAAGGDKEKECENVVQKEEDVLTEILFYRSVCGNICARQRSWAATYFQREGIRSSEADRRLGLPTWR